MLRWGLFYTSSRGETDTESEREGGRKGERKESKCNLLFPVKRARLHPFILPELWTIQCVPEVFSDVRSHWSEVRAENRGVKDRNRESGGIKQVRENSAGNDLQVSQTRRQRGERSTWGSAGRLLEHFEIFSGKTCLQLLTWSRRVSLWNQFLNSEVFWNRTGLCMIHSPGCLS